MTGKNDRTLAPNVSRETMDRLRAFSDLVEKWSPRINLVSKGDLDQIWQRHIMDSLQVFDCAPPCGHWVDIGSGGGFPGLVCAIVAMERSPETRYTLVESDQRKATFLRTVIRETGLSANVLCVRVEGVEPLGADVLSARALASLDVLIGHCARHLAVGGVGIFPKGANWKNELAEARKRWNFLAESITSNTEPKAVVLKIHGVSRV